MFNSIAPAHYEFWYYQSLLEEPYVSVLKYHEGLFSGEHRVDLQWPRELDK